MSLILNAFAFYSYVKASIVLMRAGHLFIHNYIRSLLNIILRYILLIWTDFNSMQFNLF